jgi:EpsD family peptidyl-prolyl cis-trans isomerase
MIINHVFCNRLKKYKIVKKQFIILFYLLFAVTGCTQQSGKNTDGSVAAVVNGVEITKSQIEFLARQSSVPGMTPEQNENLRRRILANLVRTELLAGKARKEGLDKSQDYSMAIYTSNNGVLAGLAEKEIVNKVAQASSLEAETVVQNNPQLFSERKLYVYDEVVFPGADMKYLETIGKMAENGGNLNQLVDMLKAKNIKYNKIARGMMAEQIPPPMLQLLNKLKPNIPQVVSGGNNISMIFVLREVISMPVEGQSANRIASQIINSGKRREVLSKELTELLNNAKITYYDEYSKEKSGKNNLLQLPLADTKKQEAREKNTVIIGSFLSGSYLLAIMALTAIMRTLFNKEWLLQLIPNKRIKITDKEALYYQSALPMIQRIFIYLLMLAVLYSLVMEIVYLRSSMSIWLFAGLALGGTIFGYILSRVYRMGVEFNWSRTVYLIISIALSMPILGFMFLIKKLAKTLL